MTPEELTRLIFQGETLLAEGIKSIEEDVLSPEQREYMVEECERLAVALGILHGLNTRETVH